MSSLAFNYKEMIRKVRLGGLLLVLAVPLLSSWITSNPEDPKLIKGKLKNGMTYYIYPNDFPKNEAVYRLFVKSGSVLENENQRGLAHFLEHMAFNGTMHYPNETLIRYLESNGAKFGKDVNAHTSYNETVYKLQLPTSDKKLVDQTMTILSDWAGGLTLDSVEIEQERGVIMSEWFSTKKGNEIVQQAFLSKLLNGSRFEDRKVIGDTSVIKHFKRQEIVDYYHQWYDPQFMAVAVVGDVSVAEIEAMIQAKFEDIPSKRGNKINTYNIANYKKRNFEHILDPEGTKADLSLIQLFKKDGPVNTEKDYESYLRRNLLNQLIKRRFANLSFDNPAYKKASMQFSGFLNTKKVGLASVEINPERPEQSIMDFAIHMEQMLQHGFLDNEIKTVKTSYGKALARKLERKAPVASAALMEEVYNDFYKDQKMISAEAEYAWYKAVVDRIDAKSLTKELRSVVQPKKIQYQLTSYPKVDRLLPSQERVYTIFDSLSKARVPQYHLSVQEHDKLLDKTPEAGTLLKTTVVPEIKSTVYELSNGARVIVKKPEVSDSKLTISGFRKGGMYALDSADYLTAQYVTNVAALSGAGNLSRASLAQYLNGKSASMRFLIDKTRSGIAGSADLKDVETLFQLLYLRWTSPRVDAKNFNLIKEKAKEKYRTAIKTDANIFQLELGEMLNGKDYTNREINESIVESELKESRILPVFNKMYGNANGYTFVLSTDLDEDVLEELILTYLGGLPSGEVDTSYVYQRPVVQEQAVRFERAVSDSPKATVSLITQKNSISDPIEIYNLKSDILAAVVRMKLQATLRERMGMIYSASVSASATPYPAVLSRQSISFNCDPKNVDILIRAAQQELEKVASDPGYFEKELADIKSNQLKEMEINKQKDSFWSTYIRNTLFYNVGNWNYINDFERILNSITAEDIAKLCNADYIGSKTAIQAVMLPKVGSEKSN